MSCLWGNWISLTTVVVSHGFLMRARKDQEHRGRWCTCQAPCLSTRMGMSGPAHGKQRVFFLWFRSRCWKQRVGAAGWHESENHHKPRPPRERKKKVAVIRFSAFVLIFLHPGCTHILQLMLNSNETPLVQTLDLRYYPDCFPFFFSYRMPNPWISWINKSFTRGLLPPHCTWCFPVPSEVKWRNSRK